MHSSRLIFWDLGGQEDLQTLWDKVRAGHRTGFEEFSSMSLFLMLSMSNQDGGTDIA